LTEQRDLELAQQLAASIGSVFAVKSITTGVGGGRHIRFEGDLLIESDLAYDRIAQRFEERGYSAVLRQKSGQVVVTAIPGVFAAKSVVDVRAIVLFLLTVVSVLYVGGLWEGLEPSALLARPLAGLPFAATLMGILIAHEAGHYLVSRHFGMAVSLPYFIPLPLPPFGTMGSVIRMQQPMRDRRQALLIGAAGPLAGLCVAIPLLVVGLLRSTVQPLVPMPGAVMEGNSILYATVKFLIFGRLLPGGGYDVFLHPMAMAAWGGLLVTMLNLIPAGQLDGGHVAYALLGTRTRWLNRIAVVVTAVLGRVHRAWLMWAFILLFLGQHSDEPLDDVTPLTAGQKALAVGMLVLFVLLFTPKPLS
jgi:membrane-associated protease RseP (regulator of RpoE activity)